MEFLISFFLSLSMTTYAQSKLEITRKISDAARIGGIDPDLAVAIATVESGLNPRAIGALNEQGVFQLRPEYHPVAVNNTNHNILVGVAYLVWLKDRFQKKYKDGWFVTFNRGPNGRIRDPTRTEYYRRVMSELSLIRFRRYIALNGRNL